jgi:hypothetical protein
MREHELDVVLLQIRTAALELRRLEGDGLDGPGLCSRRRELAGLESRLAELVNRDSVLAAA